MNSSEKNDGKTHAADAHNFPSLEKNTSATSQEITDLQFRPMFNSGGGGYSPLLPSEKKSDSEIDPEQKERVSRESFDKGIEAGRQHTCRIALEAIEPNLADFLQAFENVSAFHRHMTDTSAGQVIEMALKICKQILLAPIDTIEKDMAAVQKELRDVMAKVHHIRLCFHREDISALQELMSCFNLSWPESDAVGIDVADTLEKGRLKVERNEQARKDMELLMTERIPSMLANP
jgi:hypothetical protein